MFDIFSEKSKISWRKLLTAIGGFLFAFAVIGNQIKTGFDEMPGNYIAVIGSIFGFYFVKDVLRNKKIIVKDEKDNTTINN